MGNRLAEQTYDPSNALRQTRTRVFNTLGQLWKEIGAVGTPAVTTEFAYDTNGNRAAINAPLSRSISNQFDELNRVTQVTDAEGGNTYFSYTANDNLISVTDPRGLVTTYSYNGFGDLIQQISPDTGTTISTYDEAGNLKAGTDARNSTATYAYDALNRVTQIKYSDRTINFNYDGGPYGVGRLTTTSDAQHSLTWTYDAFDRVTSKSQTVGSMTKNVSYGYTNGRLTSLTTPSGQVATYSYSNGRVAAISVNGMPLLTNVIYEPFGDTSGWTWSNGMYAVRTHDADGKITQVDSGGEFSTYAFDDAFRIVGIVNATNPALSWTYGYDRLDRLTSASKPGFSETWSYDANGNRLTQGGTDASTWTIASGSNRFLTAAGWVGNGSATYDAAGNLTSLFGGIGTYDDAGRAVSVNYGIPATYRYNSLGERVAKTVQGIGTTYFVYDERGHLLGEYGDGGALIQETIWMEDTPVATLRPHQGGGVDVYYVHTDHLDSPRKVTRPSDNAMVWRWDADPFGLIDPASGLGPNENPSGLGSFTYNLRFPGQYYDSETTLNYNYHRYYGSALGRYVQSDPVGLAGGFGTYTYVGNSPVSSIDPAGLYRLINTTEHWGYSSDVSLARTQGFLGRSLCKCVCVEGTWKLEECSNSFDIRVQIHPGLTASGLAFAQRSELDHVRDLYRGIPRIVRAGNDAEWVIKLMTFLSKSDCEYTASDVVTEAVWAVRQVISKESAALYDEGPYAPHRHPRVPSPYR